MDYKYNGFPDYQNGYDIDAVSSFPNYDLYPYTENEYIPNIPSPDLNFMNPERNHFDQSSASSTGIDPFDPNTKVKDSGPGGAESFNFSLGLSLSPEGEAASPVDSDPSSDLHLKYIGDMLLEEDIEDKPYMFDDLIALTTTEKSLYDALGQQYPPSVSVGFSNLDSPEKNSGSFAGNTAFSTITSTSIGVSIDTSSTNGPAFEPKLTGDVGVYQSTRQAYLPNGGSGSNDPPSENASTDLYSSAGGLSGTSASEMVQNMFSNYDSALLFKKGLEEASEFLPSSSQLIIDLGSYKFDSAGKEYNSTSSKVKEKTHGREDSDIGEGRSRKQSATGVEDNINEKDGDLSDMFDKVLLFAGLGSDEHTTAGHGLVQKNEPANGQTNGSKGGKSRAKRQGRKKESVDLRTILTLCAEAMFTGDFRTANELLKQVRQHSSPRGDGSQRLAHYFANGLEARLAGYTTNAQSLFHSLSVRKLTAADTLKAFRTQVSACPFKKLSIINDTILRASEKATTLHIVDFGIMFGYYWPLLIEFLSARPGGPPKLRITGIELPQRGFKPTERIEETGRRLARYCKKFNVPFEYHPVAERNWENIRVKDLNLKSDEFLAVSSHCRFRNLLDETGDEGDCPRDAVLNLIRKMNPGIFCLVAYNASINSPFFVTRFREALLHFSSIFDMYDCILPRDNPYRETIEAEFHGREVVNAIACEGSERVERPETYKQWQGRILRAGFKTVPLDPELLMKFRGKLKSYYHKDFVIDQDGQWMLQGWKGRILYASSCWVPA